jgi:hypothetical protein
MSAVAIRFFNALRMSASRLSASPMNPMNRRSELLHHGHCRF